MMIGYCSRMMMKMGYNAIGNIVSLNSSFYFTTRVAMEWAGLFTSAAWLLIQRK